MRFLCDVHISYKIVRHLENIGHYAAHVNEMPNKWHTADQDICRYADMDDLIVITKDEDFRTSFLLRRTPRKLVRIILGNVSNQTLILLLEKHLMLIAKLNTGKSFYVELGEQVVVYDFD